MFVSETIFRAVIKLSIFAGFLSIGNVKKSQLYTRLNQIYLLLNLFSFIFVFVCLVFVIVYKLSPGDGSDEACVLTMMSNSSILIMFYMVRHKKVSENYCRFAKLVEDLIQDPVSDKFIQIVYKISSRFDRFIPFFMYQIYFLLFLQFLVKGLSYEKVAEILPPHILWVYNMPWPANKYTYWLTLTFQSVSAVFLIVVQQANIYYILATLILQILCFQHLCRSLAYIISPGKHIEMGLGYLKFNFSSPDYGYNKNKKVLNQLKHWIHMHNRLISVCNEFVAIYTPLLIAFFLVMFTILISGVFSITQNQHYFGIVEEIILGCYFCGIIFNLFILSIAGTHLKSESIRVFEEAFHAPWYIHCAEVKSSLKIISVVSRQPIILAPYRSKQFDMSLPTFIMVIRTMVSFYIALAQMKQLAETNSYPTN